MEMVVSLAFGWFIGTAIYHIVVNSCGEAANPILLWAVILAVSGMYFGVLK